MKNFLMSICLLLVSIDTFAIQPLPVDKAFTLTAQMNAHAVLLNWKIAAGYYLYRDKIDFKPVIPVNLPNGIMKKDEILGKYQVFKNNLVISVPLKKITTFNNEIVVNYQGCAAAGFCYPVVSKRLKINADEVSIVAADEINNEANKISFDKADVVASSQDRVTELLINHNLSVVLLSFFGFGLLLTFTPCILPLLPILSGIIVGQEKNMSTKKGFRLSLTYVLAMAVAYALAGIFAGLAGSYIQALLQNPWVLTSFSLIFLLLALSLFGLFELQLPSAWQEKITHISNRQTGGTYVGVAIMGILSVLIVSPCVTPPLIGALTYIGNTGDAILGGTALFVMGLGFGLPLLVIGTLGGKFLPKAGSWMNFIKILFGIVMLFMAGLLLARALPESFLQPLITKFVQTENIPTSKFRPVKTIQDLEQELANAKTQNKPVMLDFYADWCLACKQMERTTFQNLTVQNLLKDFVLLRADITKNDKADRDLLNKLNVIAPPTMIFFTADSAELPKKRIVGEINSKDFQEFLVSLNK